MYKQIFFYIWLLFIKVFDNKMIGEFLIMDTRYLLHDLVQKKCKMLGTPYTHYIVLYYYIYIYIYKLYILYRIVLRAGSSGANECSWPLADLSLITYVQDVLEIYAYVENRNFRYICRTYISSAGVRVYFHYIPWDTLYVLTLPSRSKGI